MPIVTTEKLISKGDCLAQIDGKKVFIPYALPGEKLEIEIQKDFKDYSLASIKNIIEASPYRRQALCPLYYKCGGCNMQHIEDEFQRKLRTEILKEAFEHAGVAVPEIQVVEDSSLAYRARFQLHDGGLMGAKSNTIIAVDSCPCATEEINLYLKETSFSARPKGRVHIFASSKITSIPQGFDKIIVAEESLKEEKKVVNTKKNLKMKKVKARFEGTSINPQNACTVDLLGKSIRFDVLGFFQSNLAVLEKTIPLLLDGLKGSNVLDMYSGAGTFSVFLSDIFENVTMVEHNKAAMVWAEQNMAGKKHESFGVSGKVWASYHAQKCIKNNGPFDAVVIDPPRSGMEKEVCSWLASSGIKEIRSLSCDAVTHARDVSFLIKNGYSLKKLYLLDFYPQTCHTESLAILTRKEL